MNPTLKQLLIFVRSYPLMVFSLVLFVGLGAANYFLWQRQQELTHQHEQVRRDGEALLLSLTGHSRITAQLATVQEALDVIEKNLLVEGDLAANLGYFYEIETLSHMRISQLNQLSSQPSTDGNPFKAIPFSLRVTGSYAQVINFLRQLETARASSKSRPMVSAGATRRPMRWCWISPSKCSAAHEKLSPLSRSFCRRLAAFVRGRAGGSRSRRAQGRGGTALNARRLASTPCSSSG